MGLMDSGTGGGGEMARLGKTMIWAGLEALYFTGSHHLARPFLAGVGLILTFHHVKPARSDGFQPNRSLEITPDFLDETIGRVRAAGLDIISLDEAHRRLAAGDFSRRFAVLTFDDGYRDNARYALPVLERHAAPATLFVPSSFADGEGELWWITLERAIAAQDTVTVEIDGELRRFDTATDAGKDDAFASIYWWLRSLPDEGEIRRICRELAVAGGVDAAAICRELCMDWDELAAFADNRLITIGSHTRCHRMLGRLDDEAVRDEMRLGAARIETKLGLRPQHFAYPVGDPTSAGAREFEIAAEVGFATATTTRPGVLYPEHRDHLTALPRISVNGLFQRGRYLDVLFSGAPTALRNGFRRVVAA